jgi:hypothetical protein
MQPHIKILILSQDLELYREIKKLDYVLQNGPDNLSQETSPEREKLSRFLVNDCNMRELKSNNPIVSRLQNQYLAMINEEPS